MTTEKKTQANVQQNIEPKQKENAIEKYKNAKDQFELACKNSNAIAIVNNAASAFMAVDVIKSLRELLTNEVMNEVFMPLMNTKVGFLTDRTGRPAKNGEVKPFYSIDIVRDCLIDAVCLGLLPTGNQFNILAEKMYPTKEGYTALLKKAEIKNFLEVGIDKGTNPNYAEIPVKVNYEHNGLKNSFTVIATVKKDQYSSHDQLRGKAERRAKRQLYEYITGCDFGDGDEESTIPISNKTNINPQMQSAQTIDIQDANVISETDSKKDKKTNAMTKDEALNPKKEEDATQSNELKFS